MGERTVFMTQKEFFQIPNNTAENTKAIKKQFKDKARNGKGQYRQLIRGTVSLVIREHKLN